MSFKLFFGLIAVNLIWSAHPLMGKWALESYAPRDVAWLRYVLAGLTYVGVVVLMLVWAPTRTLLRRGGPAFCLPPAGSESLRTWLLVGLLGLSAFCFSPLMQLSGLANSRATDNAVIIAMEPLMAVFFAWVFLREKLSTTYWFAFVVAVLGFILLSGLTTSLSSAPGAVHWWGNLLILISLSGEATYSVVGRSLTRLRAPLAVFFWGLGVGVLGLTAFLAATGSLPSWDYLVSGSIRSWGGLFWIGPLGTTLCYLFWMFALAQAPVASLSITLFIQPLAGSLWGYWFLNERLDGVQQFGALAILISLAFPVVFPWLHPLFGRGSRR